MRALLIVVVVGAAALVYVVRPVGGHATDSVHHQYFATGSTTVAIHVSKRTPAEQRRALIAGWNAAR